MDVQREKRVLVGVVLENRRSILDIKQIEDNRNRQRNLRKEIENQPEIEGIERDIALNDSASLSEHKDGQAEMTSIWANVPTGNKKGKNVKKGKNQKQASERNQSRRPRDISFNPQLLAKSASRSAPVIEVDETSETNGSE